MHMNDELIYEPVGEKNYRCIIISLETELARLKGDLLPSTPTSPAERDRQRAVWLELDRVSRHLADIRDQACGLANRI
jgi:hypothetical protein